MSLRTRGLSIAAGLVMVAGSWGCTARVYEPEPEPVVARYPAPVEYDVYYYDRGWYDGPNYYWYDRNHRLYHERREIHERRYRDYHRDHDRYDHDRYDRR